MAEATALLNDLLDAEREVESILTGMEGVFEHGDGIPESDDQLRLEGWLCSSFPRVQAGLERYGHAAYAQRLAEDWRRLEQSGLESVRYQPTDEMGFVECAAWEALKKGIAVLRDAIAHSEAAHERERQRAEATAALEAERDKANHERMKEIRDADAAREKTRRDDEHAREMQRRKEDRTAAEESAKRQRHTTIITSLLASSVGVAGVLVGGADKLTVLVHGESPQEAVVLSGSVERAGEARVPADLVVTCEPHMADVLPGIGENSWSMTVMASAPRPFRSYCWASGAGFGTARVEVVVPALTAPSVKEMVLPTLTLTATEGPSLADLPAP